MTKKRRLNIIFVDFRIVYLKKNPRESFKKPIEAVSKNSKVISYKIKIHLSKVILCISNNHLLENRVREVTLIISLISLVSKIISIKKWARIY